MQALKTWLGFFTHPIVMLLYVILIVVCFLWVDKPLALYFHAQEMSVNYPILDWITQLGRSIIWLLIIPILMLYFRFVQRSKQTELRLSFLFAIVIAANGICFVLKNLFGRARPDLLFSEHLFGFFGFHRDHLYHSFPSGHTTQVTAVVLSLVLLYPKQRWWFVLAGFVVIATRVLLTYHYLSDVLASVFLVLLEYKLLLYVVAQQCPMYWKRLRIA